MIYFDDLEIPWHEGLTVAGLLEKVDDGYNHVVVKVNGRPVSRPHFDATPVPDGARIIPIPMIAGG